METVVALDVLVDDGQHGRLLAGQRDRVSMAYWKKSPSCVATAEELTLDRGSMPRSFASFCFICPAKKRPCFVA